MFNALTAASCACVLIEAASMRPVASENVPKELVNSWRAEDIGGGGAVDALEMVLEIREDGTYGGMGGCNLFTGTFSLSEQTISFGPNEAARALCAPAVMKHEQRFLGTLQSELTWKVDGVTLTLTGADGTPVMRLLSAEPPSSGVKR